MLKALFWDHYGDFQWSSVAAAIALIGAISSAIFSWLSYNNSVKTAEKQHQLEQKKIDADIISKSRMHWIDNTKDIASEFLVDALKLVTVNTSLVENYSNVAIWKNLEYKNYTEIKNDKIDKKEKKRLLNLKKQ